MRGKKRTNCVKCGKKAKHLSKQGLCYECCTKKLFDNVKSMSDKAGEPWERWKKGIRRYLDRMEE